MKTIAAVLLLIIQFIQPPADAAEILNALQTREAEAANDTLKKSFDLSVPNLFQIKQMLYSGDVKAIEKLFEDLFRRYQNDVLYETPLHRGYNLFDPTNAISPADLDSWVAKTDSYIAYAARGIFLGKQGLAARGDKFIRDTPVEGIQKMIHFHQLAVKDLQAAINKNPRIMPVYALLIEIAKTSGMRDVAKTMLQKAESNDKRTYYVRNNYMSALYPRWGGSHQEMANFAKKVLEFVHLNPRLWTLQGDVDADRGDNYSFDKNYAAALESYTAALQFGDRVSWLDNRGNCYNRLGQKDKAIADYSKALYYAPTDERALRMLQWLRQN